MDAHGDESSQSQHGEIARSPQTGVPAWAPQAFQHCNRENPRTVENDPEPGAALPPHTNPTRLFCGEPLRTIERCFGPAVVVRCHRRIQPDPGLSEPKLRQSGSGNYLLHAAALDRRWDGRVHLPKHLAVEVDGLYHD